MSGFLAGDITRETYLEVQCSYA